jgi:hypothetical protein
VGLHRILRSARGSPRARGGVAHTDPDLVAGGDVCGRRLATVKRVLLTGMSGTGKSSVIQALAARGYKAVDTDDGCCEPLPAGRQRWREDAIEQLLAVEEAEVLFVAGCAENQVRFQPRFDVIILVSAPAEILAERHPGLATRTARRPANSAGSSMISGPSSRSRARPPIMRSGPRCHSATWSRRCCA